MFYFVGVEVLKSPLTKEMLILGKSLSRTMMLTRMIGKECGCIVVFLLRDGYRSRPFGRHLSYLSIRLSLD